MSKELYSIIGILIPFVGTCLGSFFVFFLKKNINSNYKKAMLGIASGVMLAASIWSLILPSIEMAERNKAISFIPVTVGLVFGVLFLIFISSWAGKLLNNKNKNINMLFLSVTLHNIPEGMAVGVCFAGFLFGKGGIDFVEAFLLSLGIAIQNVPEGAIISIPLKLKGTSKNKSFILGLLSGIVEPFAAGITIVLIGIIVPVLPYLLSFAAGAMIYVIFEELVPEMHNGCKNPFGIIGVLIGFIIMMVLDLTFG